MRNINLLPRKPLINKIYLPLLITMICFFVATGVSLSLYSFTTHSNNTSGQNEVDKLQLRINELNNLHQADPLIADYEAFVTQVKQLKSERRDWVPFFNMITTNLFKSSRIIKMAVNKDEVVTLNMEFTSLKDAAEYTTLLQRFELTEQAEMDKIKLIYKSDSPPNSAGMNGSIALPTTPPTTSEPNKVSADQLLGMLGPKEGNATSESDQLLNQINAIINKQSVKQQYGIDLPASSSPNAPILEGTPFSEQEIKAAQSALDNFKQKQLTNNPAIKTPAVPTGTPEAHINLTQYYVYEAAISIKLKALLQGK